MVLSLLAMVASVGISIYLLHTALKLPPQFRKAFSLLAIGVLISIGFHSIAEFLETEAYISSGLLLEIMPMLVVLGSLFIIAGAFLLYDLVRGSNS